MTGLKPDTDVIIEMATIVTDVDLNIVAEGPVIAITSRMQCSMRWTNGTSARTARPASSRACATSKYTMASAEKRTLEFLNAAGRDRIPRRCAATASARTAASSRATCRRSRSSSTTAISTSARSRSWRAAGRRGSPRASSKQGEHKALADIQESIRELAYYREHLLAPEYATPAVNPKTCPNSRTSWRRPRASGRTSCARRSCVPRHSMRASDAQVFFKCENLQTGGAFKFRGAMNVAAAARSGAYAAAGHPFVGQSRQCARAGGACARHARHRRRFRAIRRARRSPPSKRPERARAVRTRAAGARTARRRRCLRTNRASSSIPSMTNGSSPGRARRRSSCWPRSRRST